MSVDAEWVSKCRGISRGTGTEVCPVLWDCWCISSTSIGVVIGTPTGIPVGSWFVDSVRQGLLVCLFIALHFVELDITNSGTAIARVSSPHI